MLKITAEEIQQAIPKRLSDADAAEFIRVYIPYNQTFGFIHVKHAATLLADPDTQQSGLIMSRGNELVIAHDATDAVQVTSALSHIADSMRRLGILQLSAEMSRVCPEWSDEEWDNIKDITPIADARLIRFLGLPLYTTQHVYYNPVTEQYTLAIRGEGKGKGALDMFAGGKIKADLTAEDNMVIEIIEETKTEPNLTYKHPDQLRKLGPLRMVQRHDDCVFQRHIIVFSGRPNGEPQTTDEVSGYHNMTAQELFAAARLKDGSLKFQAHVVPTIMYSIAHTWNNRAAMQIAEKPVDLTTTASLADLKLDGRGTRYQHG